MRRGADECFGVRALRAGSRLCGHVTADLGRPIGYVFVYFSVLFDAPQIPAGIQSFQWISLEWDWNLEKIHRNETESSGMEPESTGMGLESTGMAGIHRNDRIPQE